MSDRRCATEGCLGTLPAGVGTHCPRCGGTVFLTEPKRRRWILPLVALLALAVVLLIFSARQQMQPTASPAGRPALVQAHELAARMTAANARDEAYADIMQRALAQHDYEYACQLGGEMTMASNRDRYLLVIVEEALKGQEPKWATQAAEQMVNALDRDAALKKIMQATSGK
jgi:hypothetical protein